MNIPVLCVFAVFLLNNASKLPVAKAMTDLGRYDNRHPRDQQARLEGWGRRALAAHLNGFEMFPAFGLAVAFCQLAGADSWWTAVLSVTYVISRVTYIYFYIANIHQLRSTVWFVGALSVGSLFVLALI